MHGNRESRISCAPLAQMRLAHGKAVERGITDALDAPDGRAARSGFAVPQWNYQVPAVLQ
jgi:hypothetical protein